MTAPALVALAFALASTSAAGTTASTPAWVRQAAIAESGAGAAVVLLDEARLTIDADGRLRATRRYAVRINDTAGREAAAMREVYVTGSGRVGHLRGWLVRADGSTREYGGRDTIDAALVNNDVFNEVRLKAITAVDDVRAGDMFAAEVESEDRVLFSQFEWPLQDRWRVRLVRRSVTLPAGWRADALVFNGATPAPQRAGQTTTWEFQELPELAEEPGMPPYAGRAPRLAVSVVAGGNGRAAGEFTTWEEVAAWLDALSPPGETAAAVQARARELQAAAASPVELVAAIGRLAQRIQYVSIQTGVGRGGGYRPRPAALVLERNYGDCKDKAALMRALLAAAGIKSYLVSLYAGDRSYVRPQWPSPQQFNHAIIAIALREIPAGVTSAIDHPRFGPLLFFDPTDDRTPLGELPLHEQGGLALVVAPEGGGLVRLPVTAASHHRRGRTGTGHIDAAGGLSLSMTEDLSGAEAASERGLHASVGADRYAEEVERRVARTVPRARVSAVQAETDGRDVPFRLRYALQASDYVQRQGGLGLLRLPFDTADRVDLPAAAARQTPFEVEPRSVSETFRLSLADAWSVDELPEDVILETVFGRYELTVTLQADRLTVTRSYEVPLQTIDPARYGEARAFFEGARAADASVLVLRR